MLLVLAIYGQTLGFGFITLDDPPYVTANPWVPQGLSWDGIRWAFTSFYAAIWSPLTWLPRDAVVSYAIYLHRP